MIVRGKRSAMLPRGGRRRSALTLEQALAEAEAVLASTVMGVPAPPPAMSRRVLP